MALVGTDRGTGSNNTSATTVAIVPGTSFTAGSFAVLSVAYDNSGNQGADPFVSIADNAGNTWTSRINALNDPGAANAGLVLRVFTSTIGTLTATNVVTITFNTATVAKAWTFNEFTSDNSNNRPSYLTAASVTGSSVSPTVISSTINAGDMIVGIVGAEATTQTSYDDDTLNGSWSVAQWGQAGTGASGVQANTQYKLTTGTGSQTYNNTLNVSLDWCAAWLSITEVALVPGTSFDPFGTFGFFGM